MQVCCYMPANTVWTCMPGILVRFILSFYICMMQQFMNYLRPFQVFVVLSCLMFIVIWTIVSSFSCAHFQNVCWRTMSWFRMYWNHGQRSTLPISYSSPTHTNTPCGSILRYVPYSSKFSWQNIFVIFVEKYFRDFREQPGIYEIFFHKNWYMYECGVFTCTVSNSFSWKLII